MLVGAGASVFLPGCKKEAGPRHWSRYRPSSRSTVPSPRAITADAVLAPIAQAAIEPKISAPVKKFYVERGQRVHAGELLAVLENADLQRQRMDNQGAYEAAQASYATATKAQVPEDQLKAEVRSGAGQG